MTGLSDLPEQEQVNAAKRATQLVLPASLHTDTCTNMGHNQGGLDPDPIGDSPNKRQKTADSDVDPLRAWVDSLNFFNPDLIYTKLRSAGKALITGGKSQRAGFVEAG